MNIFNMFTKKNKSPQISKGATGAKDSTLLENYTNNAAYAEEDGHQVTFIMPQFEQLSYSTINTLYERSSLLKKYIKVLIDECMLYEFKAVPKDAFKTNEDTIKRAKYVNQKLLLDANPVDTFSEIREKYLKDLFLYGRAGIEIEPSTEAQPTTLYAVPGYAIRLNVDNAGNFKNMNEAYYLIDPNDTVKVVAAFPVNSFIYFVWDKISDRVYGSVPLASIYTELITDINASRAVGPDANNLKPGVLSLPKAPKNLLRDVTTRLINAVRANNRSKIVAVNTDAKFLDLSNMGPKENIELQQWIAKRANIYNLPLFKLGFAGDTGSLNAREQKDDFRALIENIVRYELEKLNVVLVSRKLKWDDIEIVCPNFATKLEYERSRIAVRLVNGGIITPNEARADYLGYDRIDDPAADRLAISPTPGGNAGSDVAAPPVITESADSDKDKDPLKEISKSQLIDDALAVRQLQIADKQDQLLSKLLDNKEKDNENI